MELHNGPGQVTARYNYDAWGKLISITDANGNALADGSFAHLISARYRGYYYDSETGLYYLQSRYYDPETGRFINADSLALTLVSTDSLTDKNLYSYCDNNPVCRADENGGLWYIALAGAVTGGVIELASQLFSNGGDFKSVNWTNVGIATLAGGLSSMFGVVGGAVIDGVASVAMDIVTGERDGGALFETFAMSTISSVVIGGFLDFATTGIEDELLEKTSKRKIKQKVNSMYPEIKGKDINSYKNINKLKRECPKVAETIVAPVSISSNTVGQMVGSFVPSTKRSNSKTTLKAKGVRGYTM